MKIFYNRIDKKEIFYINKQIKVGWIKTISRDKGIVMSYLDKLQDKIQRDKAELVISYGLSESSIVYIGDNHYIVIKDGLEIRI